MFIATVAIILISQLTGADTRHYAIIDIIDTTPLLRIIEPYWAYRYAIEYLLLRLMLPSHYSATIFIDDWSFIFLYADKTLNIGHLEPHW